MKGLLIALCSIGLAIGGFAAGFFKKRRPKDKKAKGIIEENEKVIKENRDLLNGTKYRNIM